MISILRKSSIAIVLATLSIVSFGQTFSLKQSNENGIYRKGEKIVVTACFPAKQTDSLLVKVLKNNHQVLMQKAFLPDSGSLVIFEKKIKEPCSVIVEAKIKAETQSTGLMVNPYKIEPGSPLPEDFYAYWDQEKRVLNALMMEVKSQLVVCPDSGIVCSDTEINCLGGKPVRGYFAKPQKAGVRTLPIVLLVHAAGVKGSWCRSEVAAATGYAKKGALCFDLNAHGMLNGQPDEYYNNLESGELSGYYYKGLENRDEFYFRGMYLRLIRTIEFLTRQPEWDRKRIIVIGESQGGGQALAAAGLDHRVTAVVATVPAMCDWGGTLVDRKGGWPQPFEQNGDREKMKQVLPYFDVANLLRGCKATLMAEIGLVDQVCPSSSIYAAINQADGLKLILPVTYREHSWPNAVQRKHWDPMVLDLRNTFITNFLK